MVEKKEGSDLKPFYKYLKERAIQIGFPTCLDSCLYFDLYGATQRLNEKDTKQYHKIMRRDEYEITAKMATVKVAPHIIHIVECPRLSLVLVSSQRYSKDLHTHAIQHEEAKSIYKLISIMNSNGILHLDMHPGNIVIDSDSNEIRIIDFERSKSTAHIFTEKAYQEEHRHHRFDPGLQPNIKEFDMLYFQRFHTKK